MINKIISMAFITLGHFASAQTVQQPSISNRGIFGKCDTCTEPIKILNSTIVLNSLNTINPDTIGVIFSELNNEKENQSTGLTIVQSYFGQSSEKGIIFLFTKNKVKNISVKRYQKKIKQEVGKRYLYKMDNQPLADKCDNVNLESVKMIEEFKLKHWDTNNTDTFTLFILKTKD